MDSDSEIQEKKNPYNFNNKLLTLEFISTILNEFDIDEEPQNLNLYQNAFIHKSYSTTKNPLDEIVDKPEGALELMNVDNERLEFLGDSVLGFVVAKYIYERFETENEGFLTRIKTKLVNGEAFNAGWENKSVNDIALMVKNSLGPDVKLVVSKTDDNRSYHISSEKIKKILKFDTKYTISDAVNELRVAFEQKLLIDPLNNPNYFNIKKMQLINLK